MLLLEYGKAERYGRNMQPDCGYRFLAAQAVKPAMVNKISLAKDKIIMSQVK